MDAANKFEDALTVADRVMLYCAHFECGIRLVLSDADCAKLRAEREERAMRKRIE